jgi:hypothetical protein
MALLQSVWVKIVDDGLETPRLQGFSGFVSVQEFGWILGGMTPVSDGIEERPLMALIIRGLMHPRRTVDLVIPCRVASPQSPTPFHQAASD